MAQGTTAKAEPVSTEAVQEYYDGFFETRMLSYRQTRNARIERAAGLAKSLARPNTAVADIGCGIGLVTEALAKAQPSCRIIATDLSGNNIAFAKKTVQANNVEFFRSDATAQIAELKARVPEGFALILLVDVIEHIPEHARPAFIASLAEIAAPGATLALAYPSPAYQRFLMEHDPDELQIIDHIVEPDALIQEARGGGWQLRSLVYQDIWRENQYVHAVFLNDPSIGPVRTTPSSLPIRALRGIARRLRRLTGK
ncbi:MAG: class I SAM-dependent methyltransferase [Pseudomonadota bacterium]